MFVHVIDQLTNSAQADRRYAHTLFSLKDRSLNMIQAGGEGCALTRHVTRRPGKLARKDQVKRNLRPRALWIKQSDSPLSLY